MTCPHCSSTNVEPIFVIQVHMNTGAYYLCTDCGTPLNEDGTENTVLKRQPVRKEVDD